MKFSHIDECSCSLFIFIAENLLIHSTVHGNLSPFQSLVTTSNAAMNILISTSWCMNVPSVKVLSNKLCIGSTSKENAKMFNRFLGQFIYLPAVHESSSCFTSLQTPWYCYLHFYHSAKCVMIFHCDLNLHFLVTNDEISLHMFSGHLGIFSHEGPVAHFKIGFSIFFYYSVEFFFFFLVYSAHKFFASYIY